MVYVVILLFLLWTTYEYDIKGLTFRKKEIYWVICIIFILLSGMRYHIGIDPLFYEQNWLTYPDLLKFNWIHDIQNFKANPQTERYHVGWIFYVMCLQVFSKNFLILQISNALLINTAIFLTIQKYTRYIFSTVLVYFCTFTFVEFEFELMRESVAVSVFLLFGVGAYLKQQWILYVFIAFIAYLIHPSAVMMLFLPFVRRFRCSTLWYICIFVIPGVVIGLVGRLFLGDLLNIVLGDTSYISESFANTKEGNLNYFLMYSFRPFGLLIVYLIGKNYIRNKEFIPIFFFSLFFMFLGALAYTAARLVNYIIILDYILIAQILFQIARRIKTILVFPFVLVILYLPNIYQYKEPITLARHYPYRSILNPEPSDKQKLFERMAYQGSR